MGTGGSFGAEGAYRPRLAAAIARRRWFFCRSKRSSRDVCGKRRAARACHPSHPRRIAAAITSGKASNAPTFPAKARSGRPSSATRCGTSSPPCKPSPANSPTTRTGPREPTIASLRKAPLQGKPVARERTRCAWRCFSRSVRPRGVTPDCCSIRAPAAQARYAPPANPGRGRRRAPGRERDRLTLDRARAVAAGALFGLARRRPLRSIDAAAASAA